MAGNVEIVTLLIQHGENIEGKSDTGEPVHFLAAYLGKFEVVRLLLDMRADIEGRSRSRKTALHSAAEDDYIEVLRLLLKRGAIRKPCDLRGMTPCDVANGQVTKDLLQMNRRHRTI